MCISFPCWVNWNSHCVYFIPIMGLLEFSFCVFHSHAGFIEIPIVYISFPSWDYLSSHAGLIGIPIVYISFPSWDYLSSHCVYFIPMLG